MSSLKIGRNDPCPCRSGRKYKQCCMNAAPQVIRPDASSIAKRLETALQHHRAGHLPEASALYTEILKLQPNHPDALNLQGVVATQAGRPLDAIRLIKAAIVGNPSNASFYNNLGNALQVQGNLRDAIAAYEKALTLQPNDADAHFNLGCLLAKLERYDEAIHSYRRTLALQPKMADAFNNLGFALHRQGKFSEAAASYRKAIAIMPQYAKPTATWETCFEIRVTSTKRLRAITKQSH